ncbi:MAG: hypothetical protein CME06_11670 [Gemmatimonadetes bacterium]|nr:hypothetical protein [Gemmatimonadota bacterium]
MPAPSAFLLVAALSATTAHSTQSLVQPADESIDLGSLIEEGGAVRLAGGTLNITGPVVLVTPWVDAPIPFTALGSHWLAGGSGEFEIELQVDARPSRWFAVASDPHSATLPRLADGSGNRAFGDEVGTLLLFGADHATRWRARLSFSPEHGSMTLDHLSLVFIDGSDSREYQGQPRDDGYAKPPIYSREQWGADPPQCSSDYCSVTHLGTHHTASPGAYDSQGFDDCASNVRGIQDYHMYTRGWCDIGYNHLVCKHGKMWEGRAGGDDVRAAHDGYNCGSMGVGALGYFHTPYNDMPTFSLLDAYAELYAWKADQKGIDPFGRDYYVGYAGLMDNIYGHRDVKSTACPGDLLYSELPELRQEVDDRLGGGTDIWIYDNPSAQTRGPWTIGNTAPGRYGPDYLFAGTDPGGRDLCYWSHFIDDPGFYRLFAWWPSGSNRSPAARFGVLIDGDLYTTTFDQQSGGGQWNSVGTYWMPRGRVHFGLANDAAPGDVVIGDAMMLQKD